MINLHEYIKSSGMFKKLVIDDLLFVENNLVPKSPLYSKHVELLDGQGKSYVRIAMPMT